MRRVVLVAAALAACSGTPRPVPVAAPPAAAGDQTAPRLELRTAVPQPQRYLARRATAPVTIDGVLDDADWQQAPWTTDFVDIEGSIRPAPRLRTRVKMLWDDSCWYVAAELTEPDVWATITERDAVIFHDNDFELFIDPTGTTHRYFEVEINALNTVWDLFLPKPYRDGGSAVNAWNIDGMRSAVHVDGTLDNPADRDRGWTVELAIPWRAFADSARIAVPPREGSSWRVNFSRVEWDLDTAGGAYRVHTDSAGKPAHEHNWVWSPQGAVNMHLPEMWGVVQFGGARITVDAVSDAARWTLRRVYYAERDYQAAHGQYATSLAQLDLAALHDVQLAARVDTWDALLPATATRPVWHIRSDGRVWHD
ncbi:MAG TPA: carbohydrate-binding family 9-like protein [Gemmatimonadales bacterium]|nr:carbohydrate-binding family 9-like protein [Gemmatimonadales bacterium]